jgi:hypothetical protein
LANSSFSFGNAVTADPNFSSAALLWAKFITAKETGGQTTKETGGQTKLIARSDPGSPVFSEKTISRVEVWRGGSVSSTGLRFHTPLIKLDERFSRIQLSLQGVSHQ